MPTGGACEAWALKGVAVAVAVAVHGFPAAVGTLVLGWQPWTPGPAHDAFPVTIVWRAPIDPEPPGEPFGQDGEMPLQELADADSNVPQADVSAAQQACNCFRPGHALGSACAWPARTCVHGNRCQSYERHWRVGVSGAPPGVPVAWVLTDRGSRLV